MVEQTTSNVSVPQLKQSHFVTKHVRVGNANPKTVIKVVWSHSERSYVAVAMYAAARLPLHPYHVAPRFARTSREESGSELHVLHGNHTNLHSMHGMAYAA